MAVSAEQDSADRHERTHGGAPDALHGCRTVGHARDGIVSGDSGADLIDAGYRDPDGDRIDGRDAILPGARPDDDLVRAGAGADTVLAGAGSDEVHGEDGSDLILTDTGLEAPDRGYPGLFGPDADPTDDRDTVFGGNGNDTIRTGDDADWLSGGSGNDVLDGGVDDDTLSGDAGNDALIGGEGCDSIEGGTGNDVIYGGFDPSWPDALNIPDATDLRPDNGRDTLRGGDGNDRIYGADDADLICGDAGNDSLDGGIDDDTIFGGGGNDRIIGGEGADSLSGGADADLFIGGSAGDVVDGGEDGKDHDTLDLGHTGQSFVVHYDADNHENGSVVFTDADGNETGTLTFRNIEDVVACFTPGTLIATPKGEVPVEWLKPGDRVITRDNGIQEIRWISSKVADWAMLTAHPHLKPILIRQGSLGDGLPERDMLVSPNHRMLVANDRTALYFDEHEVLVSAKHLVAGRGVHEVDSSGVTYIHFMFDQHQIVLSNGSWSESFQPGDYTLRGVGNAQRNELFELFPELRTNAGLASYISARRTLRRHEARLLAR